MKGLIFTMLILGSFTTMAAKSGESLINSDGSLCNGLGKTPSGINFDTVRSDGTTVKIGG